MTKEKPYMIIGTSAPQRRQIAARHFADQYALLFISPDVDEKAVRDTDAGSLTQKIASAKMDAIKQHVSENDELWRKISAHPDSVAVTFDQVVVWNETEIREKPVDEAESKRFIRCYSNSKLATVQTTALHRFQTGATSFYRNDTMTYYGELSDELIERVVARGVCFHTAGAFVVEDTDMKSCMIKIEPGNVEEVQGFCAPAVEHLIKNTA